MGTNLRKFAAALPLFLLAACSKQSPVEQSPAHSALNSSDASLWVHDTLEAGQVVDGPRVPANAETFTVLFKATQSRKIRIHLHKGAGPGRIVWSNVNLFVLPSQDVISVPNGDFASGALAPWLQPNPVVLSVEPAGDGISKFALSESGPTGQVYQDIAGLTPGQVYRVSATARFLPPGK